VTVTVNAECTVIETRFGDNVSDLSYAELARAMTEAAQQAAYELECKRNDLMQPLLENRGRLPKLHELVEGMPDLTPRIPKAPEVSTAPPNAPERLEQAADTASRFTDVEQPHSRRSVTNTGW
jgi:hypothetical protein